MILNPRCTYKLHWTGFWFFFDFLELICHEYYFYARCTWYILLVKFSLNFNAKVRTVILCLLYKVLDHFFFNLLEFFPRIFDLLFSILGLISDTKLHVL